MPEEAPRRGNGAGGHGRQRWLIDLQHQLDAREAAGEVSQHLADGLRDRLREVATGADVGEDTSDVRDAGGGSERPGPGDGDLEPSGVPGCDLIEPVEVVAPGGAGASLVDAGKSRKPPLAGRELRGQAGRQPEAASDHLGPGAPGRQFRQVREGDLVEGEARSGAEIGAGQGPDAAEGDHQAAVAEMVALPTTRSPS